MSDEEKDCIFCKISKGEIPCSKVYETDSIIAFLDISPSNKGHVLVIPKKHFVNLLDFPVSLSGEIHEVIKKIAHAQLKSLKAEGFTVLQRNFPAAGQVVMHIHFHVIPRFKDDGLQCWPGQAVSKEENEEILKKLKESL